MEIIYEYLYKVKINFVFIIMCGPRISLMCFPLDGELDFILKMILFIRKWLRVATYFCFIFKKDKQNKKENPKCNSLFWEKVVYEKQDWARGSGYLSRRYDKDHITLLSP